jgi:integrase
MSESTFRRHGDWWLSQRAGSSLWYRTSYDVGTKRTVRVSLRTPDVDEAERRLVAFVAASYQPKDAAPASMPLAWVLGWYLQSHANALPSAEAARIEVRHWLDHWGEAAVADVTADSVDVFVDTLRQRGLSDGYISRILSTGRAALNRAHKRGKIAAPPFVQDVATADDRAGRQPKGRPLTEAEMARLLDAIEPDHLWRFAVIALCTMARPDAILDLTAGQIDAAGGYVRLNPPGRRQTKKRRAIVPLAPTLAAWLATWRPQPGETLVQHRGLPVASIKTAWRIARAQAWPPSEDQLQAQPPALTPADRRARLFVCSPTGAGVNPYSLRHTLGRALRANHVPGDQIALMLGHVVPGENAVTGTYSPHDPGYCADAMAALERYLARVDALMVRRSLRPGSRASYEPVAGDASADVG